jgi:hypothetical protein
MPVVHREDSSPAWATLVIVLMVVIAVLAVGYFAWWQPQRVDADRGPDINIIQPQQPPPQQPQPDTAPGFDLNPGAPSVDPVTPSPGTGN